MNHTHRLTRMLTVKITKQLSIQYINNHAQSVHYVFDKWFRSNCRYLFINGLKPKQNGIHFAVSFKCVFTARNCSIFIQFALIIIQIDSINNHDDVIKWKHFPRYWPFVRGIHRSPVNFPHKGQWHGALMFSLICVWINGWVNNREAGD